MLPATKGGGLATALLLGACIVKVSLDLRDVSPAPADARQAQEIVNSTTKVLTRKVAYVKMHKTGSTTLSNIFRRQCDNSGLRCALMRPGVRFSTEEHADMQWKASKYPGAFDVHTVHSVFDPASYEIMSPGAFKFASFRSPLSRVLSGLRDGLYELRAHPKAEWWYKRHLQHLQRLVNGSEEDSGASSRWKPSDWWQLGPTCGGYGQIASSLMPTSMFHMLDFVVLVDQFDLSLLLLRRLLGLDAKDMLYQRCRRTNKRQLKKYPEVESLYLQVESLLQKNATRGPTQQAFYDMCVGGEEERLYNLAQEKFRRQWDSLAPEEQTEVENELDVFQKSLAVLNKCCDDHPFDVYCGALAEGDSGYYERHGWRVVSPSLPFPVSFSGDRLDIWSQTSECMSRAFSALDGNETRVG